MPFVKCSVDGCCKRLQPVLKPDPRDRDSWVYRECDVCYRPACEKHSTEIDGRIVCDRCRRGLEAPPLIDLGLRLPPQPGRTIGEGQG
jgi:hypothetical protein